MALPYTSIEALTQRYVIPILADNIFKSNPLFEKFRAKGRKYQGGLAIDQPLRYARTTSANSYSGYDTLAVVPSEHYTRAQYDWKQNYVTVTISGLDQIKNSGKEAIINYLQSEMETARLTLEDNLGYQLFSLGTAADTAGYGRGAKGITGLKSAVDDSSVVDTYGGILRSTYTWWKSTVIDMSATALTLKGIQGAIGDVQDGSDRSDLIITSQDIFDFLWGLMQPQQRYQEGDLAKAGWLNLLVSGVPIVVDTRCASNDIWILNTKHLDFITSTGYDFKMTDFRRPTNQDAEVAQILIAGNLVSSKCSAQCRMKTVDLTL